MVNEIIAEAADCRERAEPSGVGTYDYRGTMNDLENIITIWRRSRKRACTRGSARRASVHY
jgi:hypothetical protein